ncbi:MAG: hypothetical protein WCI92_11525 [Bacteroidota bacterium]
MENFIYILVGIVWVAYSLYSARQKAMQKQQSSDLPPSGPSSSSPLPIPGNQRGGKSMFDDLLRELSGAPAPVQQIDQPVKSTVAIPSAQEQATTFPGRGSSVYTNIASVPDIFAWNESIVNRTNPENSELPVKKGNIEKKFNLREAIIFSELLNRKYF